MSQARKASSGKIASKRSSTTYQFLDEICDRKDLLLDEIRRDNQQMKALWNQLFAKFEPLSALTPLKRISSLMSTGASILELPDIPPDTFIQSVGYFANNSANLAANASPRHSSLAATMLPSASQR